MWYNEAIWKRALDKKSNLRCKLHVYMLGEYTTEINIWHVVGIR